MPKQDKQEIYVVKRVGDYTFTVTKKILGGITSDVYDVQLKPGDDPWCSCLGFLRQKYDKNLHKHILMVRKFIEQEAQDLLEYGSAYFKILKSGGKIRIKTVKDRWNDNDD